MKLKNTENDYINASLIVMEEAQRHYILTQVSVFLSTRQFELGYKGDIMTFENYLPLKHVVILVSQTVDLNNQNN